MVKRLAFGLLSVVLLTISVVLDDDPEPETAKPSPRSPSVADG